MLQASDETTPFHAVADFNTKSPLLIVTTFGINQMVSATIHANHNKFTEIIRFYNA